MSTQSTKGLGTLLAVGDGDSPEKFGPIAEVTSISGPSVTVNLIEATHMESTFKEYISDIPDGGTVDFEVNFLPGNTGHQQLADDVAGGELRNYQITWSDAGETIASFAALVTKFQPSATPGAVLRASISLKISGDVIW